jgi:hypothetical protein
MVYVKHLAKSTILLRVDASFFSLLSVIGSYSDLLLHYQQRILNFYNCHTGLLIVKPEQRFDSLSQVMVAHTCNPSYLGG